MSSDIVSLTLWGPPQPPFPCRKYPPLPFPLLNPLTTILAKSRLNPLPLILGPRRIHIHTPPPPPPPLPREPGQTHTTSSSSTSWSIKTRRGCHKKPPPSPLLFEPLQKFVLFEARILFSPSLLPLFSYTFNRARNNRGSLIPRSQCPCPSPLPPSPYSEKSSSFKSRLLLLPSPA